MSDVLVAHPLLLLALRLEILERLAWLPALGRFVLGGASDSRVRSGSPEARRVSPEFHGSAVSQEGQVPRAASTGAPHDGHLRAGLTGGF